MFKVFANGTHGGLIQTDLTSLSKSSIAAVTNTVVNMEVYAVDGTCSNSLLDENPKLIKRATSASKTTELSPNGQS